MPAYLVIEDLEIRSGRPPFTFTNDGGGISNYADNAASIYIEKAEHLIICRCVIHGSGNGIFSGSFNNQTQDLLIEGNYLFGNGNVGSVFHHNTYTSAIGIVYQYNRVGALRTGADGNNLKDRSAGLVVRYNWIEDGNRQLDLVDGEIEVTTRPDYAETFVYGNVLMESDGQGNSQVVHYGGDGGDTDLYRKGTAPGFIDETSQNFRPADGAPLIDAGTTLHTAAFAHAVLRHYVRHGMDEPRPADATLDIGAFERCPIACLAVFADSFESGDTSAWAMTEP